MCEVKLARVFCKMVHGLVQSIPWNSGPPFITTTILEQIHNKNTSYSVVGVVVVCILHWNTFLGPTLQTPKPLPSDHPIKQEQKIIFMQAYTKKPAP